MDADIHTLFSSDFYRVLDFKCRCTDCRRSSPEYSNTFCISFVRKGNFLFNVFRHSLDSYNGCILVTKPGYEHTVTHTHAVPDECTIFDFRKDFSEELARRYRHTFFFSDNDLHSTLVRSHLGLEFLHYHILQLVKNRPAGKLFIDNLVMDLVHQTLQAVTDYIPDLRINARLKKNHLSTIELAKEYITGHFTEDISLMEIARHCHVSPFHFSRIFKTFTGSSPHQYLQTIRLQQAALLLRNTDLPVADIAFTSGFNSIEYFAGAFRREYKAAPSAYRSGRGTRAAENSKIP